MTRRDRYLFAFTCGLVNAGVVQVWVPGSWPMWRMFGLQASVTIVTIVTANAAVWITRDRVGGEGQHGD